MPILNGLEAAERIRECCPNSKIIFLTQENDEDIRTAALATGAAEYSLKQNAMRDLVPAIEAALREGAFSHAPASVSRLGQRPSRMSLQA
jgi:DNA-binding NarL/FixJ family response regulator